VNGTKSSNPSNRAAWARSMKLKTCAWKDARCAIKEILLGPGMDDTARLEAQEQFHREASILARLDHPIFPKSLITFRQRPRFSGDGFRAGRDLKDIMEQACRAGHFLEERDVLNWAAQLCDALEYLHTQESPVVHRDIKPAISSSRPMDASSWWILGWSSSSRLAMTGRSPSWQGRGTAAYTPLEQYGGDVGHTDARSDIYSFDATLYHLLTNQAPADAKQLFCSPSCWLRPPKSIPKYPCELSSDIACDAGSSGRPTLNIAELRKELFSLPFNTLEVRTGKSCGTRRSRRIFRW